MIINLLRNASPTTLAFLAGMILTSWLFINVGGLILVFWKERETEDDT